MSNVFIFNADNDLAMANGGERYDAPRSAVRLMSDLSVLPMWYSHGGIILTPESIPEEWLRNKLPYAEGTRAMTPDKYQKEATPTDVFEPWGWNRAICANLRKLNSTILPTLEYDTIKHYASRARTIEILGHMREQKLIDSAFLMPVECKTLEEARRAIDKMSQTAVIKAPWSGSGKGLIWILGGLTEQHAGRCQRILKQQGSLLCEYRYDKTIDFAMEFYMKEGECTFAGYSLFLSDSKGTYRGNILATDNEIIKRLTTHVRQDTIDGVRLFLQEWFTSNISTSYSGYLGVDMMIYRKADGHAALHPCVEVNLRRNMGILCRSFYDTYVTEGAVGEYIIVHQPNATELKKTVKQMEQKHPLKMSNGRVESGFLQMTYISEQSEYMAYSIVG